MTQAQADRAATLYIIQKRLDRLRRELAALTIRPACGHVLTRKA